MDGKKEMTTQTKRLIELDDVLKIMNKIPIDKNYMYMWAKGTIIDEIKQLANHNSTQFKGGNKFKSDEALGLGDAVNHVQQDEETSVTSTNIPVCKRPRFYYMDLENYTNEFLIEIILYLKQFEPLTQGEKT